MSNVSFPAAHLSAYDIGHRITIVTPEGAKITDELTQVMAFMDIDGETHMRVRFRNTQSPSVVTHRDFTGFEVKPDQMVKRVNK